MSKEDLYEPSHGKKVLELTPGLKKIVFIGFKPAAYDKTTHKMAFTDPTRPDDFISISGTKMRKYARGEMPEEDPPEGFMVPSAWKIVKECARPTSQPTDQLTNQLAI